MNSRRLNNGLLSFVPDSIQPTYSFKKEAVVQGCCTVYVNGSVLIWRSIWERLIP